LYFAFLSYRGWSKCNKHSSSNWRANGFHEQWSETSGSSSHIGVKQKQNLVFCCICAHAKQSVLTVCWYYLNFLTESCFMI
jgi:hypothetical protein